MPASSRHGQTLSPPLSTAYSSATAGQTKLNVVARLAIEGKARKGVDGKADGASIKMFLRIVIPLESVSPGSTIPLFPEENVKILDSQVHPLDANAAPYNFSSTTCALLHRGARALNLPARSRVLYTSLFGSLSSASSSTSNPPPLEERYVGHILVSGYNVSYVLPKEFPPRMEESHSRSSSSRRMSSAATMQFMAAIDMWIPFLSKPPHSPYLLSIPIPRCMNNNIKLRIFPPISQSTLSASMASLSSAEEDLGSWDLTSNPHVTHLPTPSRHSRSHSQQSYTHFADDESSDSSTAGFADGCGIQGTFQSAERIRIRWARPQKPEDSHETTDGRRRAGIREVSGVTTCAVLEESSILDKGKDRSRPEDGSIVMNVEYNAACKGVWSPGVATMLGLDVGLDVGECDVDWAPDSARKWVVSGSTGFTGFSVGPPIARPSKPPISRQSSASDSTPFLLPFSPDGRPSGTIGVANGSAQNAMRTGSSASLLRVPLPAQSVPDYSFEGSPNITPTSSIASLATIPSSPEQHRKSQGYSLNDGFTDTNINQDTLSRPPDVPVTVHVNMNDLPPPSKNVLNLSISGSIIVTPRKTSRTSSPPPTYLGGQPDAVDKNPITLPRFRVLHCEKETTTILLRSELGSASIDVYTVMGNIADAQSRKTVVQPGGQTKCGSEGARIAIRSSPSPMASFHQYSGLKGRVDYDDDAQLFKTPRTNGLLTKSPAASALRRTSMFSPSILRPTRDGPLMIPSVVVAVTPLLSNTPRSMSRNYAVRVSLPAPSDAETEWLEFGLAIPSTYLNVGPSDSKTHNGPPKVKVASASLEGVPVHFETTAAAKSESESSSPVGLPFEETSGKEWVTWVKIHVGDSGGGKVEVVYLVTDGESPKNGWRAKGKEKDSHPVLDVLLPTFSLPVGTLEVHVETQAGLVIEAIRSNLTHESSSATGKRLLHYSMTEFFYPKLSVTIRSADTSSNGPSIMWRLLQILAVALPTALVFLLLVSNSMLEGELAQAKQSLISYPSGTVETVTEPGVRATVTLTLTSISSFVTTETTTETTTVTTSVRWLADSASPSSSAQEPPSLVTTTIYLPAPTSASSSISTLTQTPLTPVPSSSSTFDIALQDLPFLWPVRLEFPSLDEVPQVARATLQKTWAGFGIAWQLFRRVLHYPLPPP